MTAGSIPVPAIIPLRTPLPGRSKTSIDSNTKIELSTDGKLDVSIHYTINGTKPNPFPKLSTEKCTMQYMGPFTLPAGKQTVKAIALSKDGMRESNVVTKVFDVEFVPVPPTTPVDDDMGFQEEIDKEMTQLSIKRAHKNLLLSEGSAWTNLAATKNATHERADGRVSGSSHRRPRDEPRFLNTRRSREVDRSVQKDYSHRARRLPESTAAMRLEQELDQMKNSYYTGDVDLYSKYGDNYDNHAAPPRVNPNDPRKMGMCQYCRSVVPFTVPSCVVCEGPIPGQHRPPVQSQWLPVSYPLAQAPNQAPVKKPTASIGTQTVGLFYPSNTELIKKQDQEEEKKSFEKQMKDRRPLLTTVSPGKGYWRKQVDHICAHLKAHAQNEAEFRALIGEPKMGKLLTSTVQEDGYELSVTLTFALRSNKDPLAGRKITMGKDYLSQHTEQDSWQNSESEEVEEIISSKKRTVKKIKPKKKTGPKMAEVDVKLLKELGSSGDGDPSEVQQLLDEGANAECTNKDGLSCLYVAVKNKRVESIPVLVNSGADVNIGGPSSIKGNTPLHEAVGLGPSGLKVVDMLLNCGANQKKKNDRGETPYDLAVKGGYDSIVNKFASALGSSQLQKMVKPKSSINMY